MTDGGLLCRRARGIHNRPMLGFFDESGDPGLKVGQGSSRYFVVALVTFNDDDEALRCDRRIDALREELRLSSSYEFHYAVNSMRVRRAFLNAIQTFDFGFHTFVLDKSHGVSGGLPFASPRELYMNLAVSLMINASPYIHELALVIDKGGNRRLRTDLLRYLRGREIAGGGGRLIRSIKQQDSHRNNLLQLADYVASMTGQAMSERNESANLFELYLRRKEVTRGTNK